MPGTTTTFSDCVAPNPCEISGITQRGSSWFFWHGALEVGSSVLGLKERLSSGLILGRTEF